MTSSCASPNVATVATSTTTDAACACVAPECHRVEAAVVTAGGEMIAIREGTRDIVAFRFAGDDVKSDVVARLSCMGAPVLERRPEGVFARCALPPAETRIPARIATPAPASVKRDAASTSTTIAMGPRSAVVAGDACFAPHQDGLVTCEPAGHCFVYSRGQLRSVQLR